MVAGAYRSVCIPSRRGLWQFLTRTSYCTSLVFKLRQIDRPGVAIRQKLADSEIICVSTFDKSMVISCLDPDLNNYFMTQLLFDLDIRTLIFASRTKLESGPRFTKICLFFWCFISYYKECLSVKIWGLHSQMPFPGTGYFPKKCRKFPVLSIREHPIPSPD